MLKRWLRRWLGLNEVEYQVKKLAEAGVTRGQIRQDISDSLAEILKGDAAGIRLWSIDFDPHRQRFECTLRSAIRDQVEVQAKAFIAGRIDSEKFIDEVVERLNRKQLKGE